tara:strand:- start:437 stop:580 length:144 start_codon:yes stop_codon:yes gene_type:complete
MIEMLVITNEHIQSTEFWLIGLAFWFLTYTAGIIFSEIFLSKVIKHD